MRFILALLLVMGLNSCFSRQSYMSRDAYENIMIGSSVEDVKQVAGEPMQVTDLSNGSQEYLYVEKIQMGQQVAIENHYIIVISQGKVVSKKMTTENPPAYNIIYQNDPSLISQ